MFFSYYLLRFGQQFAVGCRQVIVESPADVSRIVYDPGEARAEMLNDGGVFDLG